MIVAVPRQTHAKGPLPFAASAVAAASVAAPSAVAASAAAASVVVASVAVAYLLLVAVAQHLLVDVA